MPSLRVLPVLLLLLVAADRVGVVVASRVVASKLRACAALTSEPSVHIRGFPFLTQALCGRYDQIDVSVTDLVRSGVRLSRLDASLHGVRLTLAQVLSGSISNVPVETITASTVVTYSDVAARGNLAGLAVTPLGAGVQVTARLTELGQRVTASTESTVRLSGRFIVIMARRVSVLGQFSGLLVNALAGRLDFRVPIGTLPYGLTLTAVHVSPAGLVLDASTGPTVIPVRARSSGRVDHVGPR